jgi:hypothetical protein
MNGVVSTEQALLLLLAALLLGVLGLVAATTARTTGTVKLELELGARALERALRERDQARALAETVRNTPVTVTSPVTQSFVAAPLNAEAKVTVTGQNGVGFTVEQQNDPDFLAKLEEQFQRKENERLARRSQ